MSHKNYWYFNTDETEDEGKNAYEEMINQQCVAAWGYCRGKGAEKLLQRPRTNDVVFLYRAGFGMVACGTFTEKAPVESQTVFAQEGEYHRQLDNLRILSQTKLLSAHDIREATGYELPARHILCKIHNASANTFLTDYFEKHGDPA
jgi:hypothetical protein